MNLGTKTLAAGGMALAAAFILASSANAFWGHRYYRTGYSQPAVVNGAYYGGGPNVFYGGTGVAIGTGYRSGYTGPTYGSGFYGHGPGYGGVYGPGYGGGFYGPGLGYGGWVGPGAGIGY